MIETLYLVTANGKAFNECSGYPLVFSDRDRALSYCAALEAGGVETFNRDPKGQFKHIASYDMRGLNWHVTPTRRQREKMAKLVLGWFGLEDVL